MMVSRQARRDLFGGLYVGAATAVFEVATVALDGVKADVCVTIIVGLLVLGCYLNAWALRLGFYGGEAAVLLKCQCCGIEKEFSSESDAFDVGWDVPSRFGYTACDLCPGICIFLGMGHEKAHAHWKEHGRPTEFNTKCDSDESWDCPPRYVPEER